MKPQTVNLITSAIKKMDEENTPEEWKISISRIEKGYGERYHVHLEFNAEKKEEK